jgi:hypothetical protein
LQCRRIRRRRNCGVRSSTRDSWVMAFTSKEKAIKYLNSIFKALDLLAGSRLLFNFWPPHAFFKAFSFSIISNIIYPTKTTNLW